ncbi:MAG TPA: EAL domain-containing protein [Anaerolineales bacterium]|nr:EAL domain-containing protein [Anaerolineales bacterium]
MHTKLQQHGSTGEARHIGGQPALDVEFSIAFQPIVDICARRVVSFEALVRGARGEPAEQVFAKVGPERLHQFDQACRLKAIEMAARLDLHASLNLNFLPGALTRSAEYLQATFQACWDAGFPVERLVFELAEPVQRQGKWSVHGMFEPYNFYGFKTAIDDFGNGFTGLRRLAEYRPDYIKLDRRLISGIQDRIAKQLVVAGIRDVCRQLGIQLVAEGVETVHEYRWLRAAGIRLLQGYYFAQPAFEALAEVSPAAF